MRAYKPALCAASIVAALSFAAPASAGPFLDEINSNLQDLGPSKPGTVVAKPVGLPGLGLFKFRRQTVSFKTREAPGTIVIDTNQKFLYYVLGDGQAIRYGVGVGREGFGWHGTVYVGKKAEWPSWRPPEEMIAREKKRGRDLPDEVDGGPGNPLGARALYLYNGFSDTAYRIHGTSEPWTIGHNVSSGCFRLYNADVIDLYQRAHLGTKVVVL